MDGGHLFGVIAKRGSGSKAICKRNEKGTGARLGVDVGERKLPNSLGARILDVCKKTFGQKVGV